MLNIVVPMAGAGSRFSQVGFEVPKPLIKVNGREMISLVIRNLTPIQPHRFIFIAQRVHDEKYKVANFLKGICPSAEVVFVDGLTRGAAETVLFAANLIDSDNPLMIANSDQLIDYPIDSYLSAFEKSNADGYIMTMKSNSNKWSYIGFDNSNNIIKVLEKQVISDEATVGIYNFASGSVFVESARLMISNGKTVNGEYYVAPVFNELIESGLSLGYHNIGSEYGSMIGLGTPEDLNVFLKSPRTPYIGSLFE